MPKKGDQVTVQFGENKNVPWYEAETRCIVIAVKPRNPDKGIFEEEYLVQKTFNGEQLGVGVVPNKTIAALVKGQLLSFKHYTYGSSSPQFGPILTREEVAKKLGFKL